MTRAVNIDWYPSNFKRFYPINIQDNYGLNFFRSNVVKLNVDETQRCLVPEILRSRIWRSQGDKRLGNYWPNRKNKMPLNYLRKFIIFTKYYKSTAGLSFKQGGRFAKKTNFDRVRTSWRFRYWTNSEELIDRLTFDKTSRKYFGLNGDSDSLVNIRDWYFDKIIGIGLKTIWLRLIHFNKSQILEYKRWSEIRSQLFKTMCYLTTKKSNIEVWTKTSNISGLFSWVHLGTKSQWGLKNIKFKHSLRQMYSYLRYTKKIWKFKRTGPFLNTIDSRVMSKSSFRFENLKRCFNLRLDSFLVNQLKIKTLSHSILMIKNGHVFINGLRCINPSYTLKSLDVVTFSTRALVWFRLLRRVRRDRKLRKSHKRIRRFRGSGSTIYGPRWSHAVVWNISKLAKTDSISRRTKLISFNNKSARIFLRHLYNFS